MILYFTGAVKQGDPQTESRLSLGGHISSSQLPNGNINNLFGEISQYTLEKQVVEYRALALKNTSGATIPASTIYYQNNSEVPLVNLRMAIVAFAEDDCGLYMEKTSSVTAKPINATFIDNRGTAQALTIPSMDNNTYVGIWIERSFNASKISEVLSCDYLLEQFDTTPVQQISQVDTVADVAGSLNDTYWFFETRQSKFFIWYDVDATGTLPVIADREPIRVAITAGETADDVALKTAQTLIAILEPRGEASFVHNVPGPVITITNTLPGLVTGPTAETSGFTTTIITPGASGTQENVEEIALTIAW